MRKKEELRQARGEMEETMRYETVSPADDQVIRRYAGELRDLLSNSPITEQRSVLQSFCKRIEVNDAEVKIYYTIPVPPDSAAEEAVGVVPIIHHG